MTKFQWHHAGRSTMDEKESGQPPAVPFLWEEKLGTTMNWKPPVVPTHPTLPSPANLTPSVPFLWEEMPGKPLPSCLERPLSTESTFLLPLKSEGYDNDDHGYEPDDMFDLDLVSTTEASKAAQVQITFTAEDRGGQSEGHSSSASRGGSSTSFSDWLSSDFFHKVGSKKGTSSAPQRQQNEDDGGGGGSGSVIAKRVIPTLGELIRMSGRRSFNRIAAENQTRTKDCSKECTNRRAFKCWIFGIRGRRES